MYHLCPSLMISLPSYSIDIHTIVASEGETGEPMVSDTALEM